MSAKKITRVCFLNPHGYVEYPPPLGKTDTGGQTLYEFQLAQALGKKGIKVDIVTRQFDDRKTEEQVFENVKIVRIPCGGPTFVAKEKMFELMPEFVDRFVEYIAKTKKKYSIIHSHYWDAGYAGMLLKKELNIPHVHSPHSLGKLKNIEMAVEDLPIAKLKPAYRYHVRIALEQRIYNSADAVHVLCETNRIQLLRHYIVDFEKIKVIFPGVDTQAFTPKSNGVDRNIKLKENAILTMCRFVPAKGIDRVIEAVSLLRNRIPFHLYMGGGTIDEYQSDEERINNERVREYIKKYKLQNYCTFLGYVDHDKILPGYYRKADIFILPSRFEPFGLTTLEAMACGTVPLVSSVAGSKEVIIDGLNGYTVDTHNRKKLAEAIFKVLSDPKLKKKVSENAAFTMREHYSWDHIVDKFIKLYTDLSEK
ncbi:MAG: glycosyltransferase [Candidatus Roizmanbacteria bacterium]|nr:glycosyltransferase [Candidatus Roizmanbacteria bacterium]